MRCLLVPSWFDDSRISYFMQKFDNDVVLLDADAVEVFSYNLGEVVFALTPELCSSCHRGRLFAHRGLR